VTVLEPKSEFAHQISSTSDDSRPRYSDKPFSKWWPSAILNFQNLAFWSRDLCLNVILHLHTKFQVNRTINVGDIAKRRFSIWRPSAILNLQYFDTITWPSLKPKSAAAHKILLKSDDLQLKYSDKTIFKMAAVRHLEFSKIVNLVT